MGTRCTATTAAGKPCRAWAVAGSDPPRCAPHGGGQAPVGAPAGNGNAIKHGLYRAPGSLATIDDAIQHLAESLEQLADYIREHQHELTVDEIARLCAVRGQNLSRFARLLRDKLILSGDTSDQLDDQIQEALDLGAQILGVDL